jgi:tetratricopeptide (TPR) repeat protein
MMHRLLLATFLMIAVAPALLAQTGGTQAEAYARTAIELMESGQIDRAITLLDSAIDLDPTELSYRYEKAYAYLLKKDYNRGVAIIEPLLRDTAATELFFHLAAAMHNARGDTSYAAGTLRRGLERFPSSGMLYNELGNMSAAAGSYPEAVVLYERGMEVQPPFPDNYYRAALILLSSSEPIWGIVYGEMFMNLERQTERTQQMSDLLLKTYRRTIEAGGDSLFAVRFSAKTSVLQTTGSNDPQAMLEAMRQPEWIFEMTAMQALSLSDHCRKQGVSLDCLDQFRTEFVRRWFDEKHDLSFPSRLFTWHRTLLDLGYFDEYNHWLLGAGDPDAFYAWVEKDPESFEHFQKWFRVNGMSMRSEP